jgi:transposase-like protein
MREVLRLKFVGGVPTREIARRIGVAASTVRTTTRRFQAASLSWPLPDELTDAALEARLFPDAGMKQGQRRQVEPDWASIHRELKRKHVTLSILWDEYIARDLEGYRYSRFCELYRIWEGKLSVTMRQTIYLGFSYLLTGGFLRVRRVSAGNSRGARLVPCPMSDSPENG